MALARMEVKVESPPDGRATELTVPPPPALWVVTPPSGIAAEDGGDEEEDGGNEEGEVGGLCEVGLGPGTQQSHGACTRPGR